MRINKFKRKIQEALDKFGDIVVVEKIDYWWRENYEGAIGWKVRETMSLSDFLKLNTLDDIEPYNFLKLLEHPNQNLPLKVNITYADTKERYEQQNAEHPKEEKRKEEELTSYAQLYYPFICQK